MDVQVAETGPCSRTLTITVPSQLVDSHLEQMYESARQQVQLKGFRPGKVPKHIVQKRFGSAILAEAKEQMLNRFFGEACRDHQITPIGRIEVEGFAELEVKAGAPLQFSAKIDVRPEFELQDVKGLEVEGYTPEATEQDIDNALKEIAHQRRSIQPTTEPAQDGDFVKADTVFVDQGGNAVRERKDVQLNTRIAIHGCDEAAYTQALLGATAGQSIEIPLVFPDTFEVEAVRGQNGTVRLQTTGVLRVTPAPIDDSMAQSLEFADLAALRQDLATRIGSEKLRLGKAKQEEQCLQQLFARHEFAVPPSLIEEQKRAALGQFAQRLKENGASDDDIQQRLADSEQEASKDAERRVRLFFLIEAVAKQQKLFVTEGDIEAELRAIAQANSNDGQPVTPGMVRDFLEQNNQLGELRLALLERKVRDFLRENAKIVDSKAG